MKFEELKIGDRFIRAINETTHGFGLVQNDSATHLKIERQPSVRDEKGFHCGINAVLLCNGETAFIQDEAIVIRIS